MVRKMFLMLVVVVLTAGLVSVAIAQEEEMIEDNLLYTYGEVKNVTADQLTILEYDFEQQSEIEGVYTRDADTLFVNFDTWEQIEPGIDVDVEYEEIDGKKVVRTIAKVEEGMEEEMGEDVEQGVEVMEDSQLQPVLENSGDTF